jgi:orotidine-5'-phosphate decarboxylase
MTFLERLESSIQQNRSFLCVGLDPDLDKLPAHLPRDAGGVEEFLNKIIESTAPSAVVYKPNLAFFGSLGIEGLAMLQRVIRTASARHPVILDAKFGDIGNTARHYAHYAYEVLGADAVTLNPYLGSDTLSPFLEWEKRFAFILGITSNPGASEIQKRVLPDGARLFESLAGQLDHQFPGANWGWVAGATQVEEMTTLRSVCPNRWFLIPGVGAQGGAVGEALEAAKSPEGKPLAVINVSRSVLFASRGEDFAAAAAQAAHQLVLQMRAAMGWGD